MMAVRNPQDLGAGLLFVVIGITGAVGSLSYDLGSAGDMGPGYVPLGLFSVITIVGALVALRGIFGSSGQWPTFRWRPFLFVIAATVAFAALVRTGGLVLATLALVPLASFADEDARLGESLLAALALAAFGALVFVVALGVPAPLFPWSPR